jgi:hypothetical protein
VSAQLRGLLEHLVAGEPADPSLDAEVEAVFRRAGLLRRRRTRMLAGAGAAAAAVVATAGYLIFTTLLPATTPAPPAVVPTVSAVPVPSAIADPVLALVAPLVDGKKMHVYPRSPERGNGWRQYSVVTAAGDPRGTVQVAVYAAPEDLCFPVLSGSDECAETEWAPKGVEYVRYDDDKDVDWQVHQTISRRISDGRVVAVMATGERGTDNPSKGKPALSGKEIERIATDPRLGDAFGPGEDCWGPSAGACPVFRVPVPAPDEGENRDKKDKDPKNKDSKDEDSKNKDSKDEDPRDRDSKGEDRGNADGTD